MERASAYRLAHTVRVRRFQDELVVLDLERDLRYSLNATGAELLRALLEGQSEDGVAGAVAEAYGVSKEDVQRDLNRLIAQLIEQRILVRA